MVAAAVREPSRVLERIGRGAFGEVYRAWDTRLDREVALKVLPPRSSDERRASEIIEEGRLLARVRHPNVVTIYGAEQIGDQIGLWMEFVRGLTLEAIEQAKTSVSTPKRSRSAVELCPRVAAVHGAGLLHRDIKAQNVMRAEDGRVVLMDFGTGRELEDDARPIWPARLSISRPRCSPGQSPRSGAMSTASVSCSITSSPGRIPSEAHGLRELRRAHERGERIAVQRARPDLPEARPRHRARDRARNPSAASRTRRCAAGGLGGDQRRRHCVRW